jgi:hypothetical protein
MERSFYDYRLSNLSPKDLELFKSIFNYDEVRGSSSGSKEQLVESHYLRVYNFRYWDEIEVNRIDEMVKEFNAKSESCIMKITDYHDYEVEWDNDRSWPASFTFSIIPKQ